jgi:hypothetical protein
MDKHILMNILQNFILGGAAVAFTSYIGTFLNPLAGAIIWAYAITILPSVFFMRKQKKSNKYISKFLFSTTFALILLMGVTLLLSYLIGHSPVGQSLWVSVGKSNGGFLIGAISYFLIIKAFHLEKYFM